MTSKPITLEELNHAKRMVLLEAKRAPAGELAVETRNGVPCARWTVAKALEGLGLLAWKRCAGSAGGGTRVLRVSYALTPAGEAFARALLD